MDAAKGRSKKRWNEVVRDDLKKCGLDRALVKEKKRWNTCYWENVRHVRARTRDVKRDGRERSIYCNQ